MPLALTALARQLYAMASAAGYGRKDFSAVGKLLESFSAGEGS